MNWLLEHTQAATIIAIVGYIIFMGVMMAILASGKTAEAEDLQGAPETLGDFPPLDNFQAWENAATEITNIDLRSTLGHFPEGAYVRISKDGNHIVLATKETANAISYGNGKYLIIEEQNKSYGLFICDACKNQFEKSYPDQVALKESYELFPEAWASTEEMGMVCEDCFKKYLPDIKETK